MVHLGFAEGLPVLCAVDEHRGERGDVQMKKPAGSVSLPVCTAEILPVFQYGLALNNATCSALDVHQVAEADVVGSDVVAL